MRVVFKSLRKTTGHARSEAAPPAATVTMRESETADSAAGHEVNDKGNKVTEGKVKDMPLSAMEERRLSSKGKWLTKDR